MRALGMVRPELVRALLIPHVVVAVAGARGGDAGSVRCSPRCSRWASPVASTRTGALHFDALVLVPGAVAVVLVVLVSRRVRGVAGERTEPAASTRHRTSALARVAA